MKQATLLSCQLAFLAEASKNVLIIMFYQYCLYHTQHRVQMQTSAIFLDPFLAACTYCISEKSTPKSGRLLWSELQVYCV